MKVNFEKKHFYLIFGVLVLLSSSVYVIAQSPGPLGTSLPWDSTQQSHGVLYTDIITSKSTTAPRVVQMEALLVAKEGISLGGVKKTSWPSGGASGAGQQCYIVRSNYLGSYPALCNSPDTNSNSNIICENPTGYNNYNDLIHEWCGIESGGCSITIMDTTSPWKGGYDQKQLISYVKTDGSGQSRRCNFIKRPGEPMGHFCEGSNTAPEETQGGLNTAAAEIISAENEQNSAIRCRLNYDGDGVLQGGATLTNTFTGESFSGFYLSLYQQTASEPYSSNGCALMVCNNG